MTALASVKRFVIKAWVPGNAKNWLESVEPA